MIYLHDGCRTRVAAAGKPVIYFNPRKPNRHSRFFLLHLENRLTGHSPSSLDAELFQPVCVYSGKRAVRREYAEIGEEWPAIEIQGKLHRARQKRRGDLWPGIGRWKTRERLVGINVDYGNELPRRD